MPVNPVALTFIVPAETAVELSLPFSGSFVVTFMQLQRLLTDEQYAAFVRAIKAPPNHLAPVALPHIQFETSFLQRLYDNHPAAMHAMCRALAELPRLDDEAVAKAFQPVIRAFVVEGDCARTMEAYWNRPVPIEAPTQQRPPREYTQFKEGAFMLNASTTLEEDLQQMLLQPSVLEVVTGHERFFPFLKGLLRGGSGKLMEVLNGFARMSTRRAHITALMADDQQETTAWLMRVAGLERDTTTTREALDNIATDLTTQNEFNAYVAETLQDKGKPVDMEKTAAKIIKLGEFLKDRQPIDDGPTEPNA
jgi:hypothetical protein